MQIGGSENTRAKGGEKRVGVSYLEYQVVRKGFCNMNFEHRPKGHEGMNRVGNARESILGRENSKYKCLEAEAF